MSKIKDLRKEALNILKGKPSLKNLSDGLSELPTDKGMPLQQQRHIVNTFLARKANSIGGSALIAKNYLLHGGTPECWLSNFKDYVVPQLLLGMDKENN